jgi:hypothetical protein
MFWSVTATTSVKASVSQAYIYRAPLILCDNFQRKSQTLRPSYLSHMIASIT